MAYYLGIPESEVRRGLDVLSELALVRPSTERQGRPSAVPPDIGLSILIHRQQAQLAAQQQHLAETRAAADRLIAEFAEQSPSATGFSGEQLTGMEAITHRLAELRNAARTEMLTFCPGDTQAEEEFEVVRPFHQELLERGIRLRLVLLDSVRNHPACVEYAQWLTGLGGQVRTVPSLPTRLIIIDGTTALLPVDDEGTEARSVVLTGQGVLTALGALFDRVWDAGQPLGCSSYRDALGLTAQEAATVAMLAEGRTDEAIAKRLGVSQRTARRIASGLMERLGARSRFEAGVLAVQAGWLPWQPTDTTAMTAGTPAE
ncbi:LuxR C-terminal-related transcriptional regulator [Streptomyces sp. NPDC052396]|uniref:helix-turn-helix transcriptional regulator n=1 Tax=Streptomyces sp. NPDC052396 TaxID=3365689 RepID=UPI0037D72DCF